MDKNQIVKLSIPYNNTPYDAIAIHDKLLEKTRIKKTDPEYADYIKKESQKKSSREYQQRRRRNSINY